MTTKNTKTYYLLILDRSGSMLNVADLAISSFNEQLQLIKKLDEKYQDQKMLVSLTLFNDEVTLLTDREEPSRVEELSRKTYQPGGMTALHDAIGVSVKKLDKHIHDEVKYGMASAVVVIITDGYENASLAFDGRAICSMIEEYESSGNWSFSYIGSTPEALEIASRMNIHKDRSIKLSDNNFSIAFSLVNDSVENYIMEKSQGYANFKLKNKEH
ncbi:MAG TPA: vWA domain-containing protein [Bacteroidales bacterium]|nr:vWA domain-containing protein [Bacteroidales bacterium]